MLIERTLTDNIKHSLQPGKVVIIQGARRTGKTTIVKEVIKDYPIDDLLYIDGEDVRFYDQLSSRRLDTLAGLIGDKKLLVIDEAQKIPNIGTSLKIIVDSMPELKILVTGSSVLGIKDRVGAPLLGRAWTFMLFPLSYGEIKNSSEVPALTHYKLDELLRYGSYPEVIKTPGNQDKEAYLIELTNQYLYRDIVDLRLVNEPLLLRKVLELLALQVGSEVSIQEMAGKLNVNRLTVQRYIDLLEASFIVFRLGSLRRNLRNEVTKYGKYFFWDLGIRNALIGQFNSPDVRSDMGALWENFCIVERRKKTQQPPAYFHDYFWRLQGGSEIDYVEESGGMLSGFEMKWSKKKKSKPPAIWKQTYENSSYNVINPDNFETFLGS